MEQGPRDHLRSSGINLCCFVDYLLKMLTWNSGRRQQAGLVMDNWYDSFRAWWDPERPHWAEKIENST